MTGKVMVGGVEYYVSGWTKARQNGEKFISMSFKPVSAQKPAPDKKQDNGSILDMSDDTPW